MVAVCPALLNTGFCPDVSTCDKRHDVPICRDCHITCISDRQLQAHFQGKRHRRQLAGQTITLFCPLCHISVVGQIGWGQHVTSKRHLAIAEEQSAAPDVEPVEAGEDIKSHKFCAVCKTYVPAHMWTGHSSNKVHKRRLVFSAVEAGLEEAAKDKHGVVVFPSELDFMVVSPGEATKGVSLSVDVKTTVPLSNVTLVEYKLSSATTLRRSSS